MSRLVPPKAGPSKGPSKSGLKPSASKGTRASASKTSLKSKASTSNVGTGPEKKKSCLEKKIAEDEEKKKKEKEFKMPAFSISARDKNADKANAEKAKAEKMKNKMIRRNKPPGEDIAKLAEILKGIRKKNITAPEFIGLISPSTGDNGALIRAVYNEEVTTFRNTARKIYETMTQDVSDVLTNEHIQLTESNQEKVQLFADREQRAINEIYQLCPDFVFEHYYGFANYLAEKFAIAKEELLDPTEAEALMRQEAYHRYQWLKTEGDRLKEENTKLQGRMKQLKKRQRDEIKLNALREQQAEEERQRLEDQQEELVEKLEELNTSVEKELVQSELASAEPVRLSPKKLPPPKKGGPKKTRFKQGEDWAGAAAADIESSQVVDTYKEESSKVSVKVKGSKSKTSVKGKRRPPSKDAFHYSPIKTPPREEPPKERSPFHFSPVKTPPREQAPPKERSPFHFSPIKTPPQRQQSEARARSPFHYSPPPPQQQQQQSQMEEQPPPRVHYETQTVTTEQFRRGRAPRDTWGGFQ